MLNFNHLQFTEGKDGSRSAFLSQDGLCVSVVSGKWTNWEYDLLVYHDNGSSDAYSHLDEVWVTIIMHNLQMELQ